jgi:UDP-2-acetamido-2-deoxy-ribo-hexuluronate aminotransferase
LILYNLRGKLMDFCNLQAQYALIKEDVDSRTLAVFAHGKYIFGPEITELEKKCAEFAGVKYALSASSGTDALLMGLIAYDVKPGDYVITTPFTFIATAEMIALIGAIPLYVDIEDTTFNIDPTKLAELLKNPPVDKSKIKGVIAVDLYGQCPDYSALEKVIADSGLDLFLMEDAAQSFGAVQRGKRACSFGDLAATSFFPSKPLGCYGDGGMVLTNCDKLAEKLTWIRNHGQNERYRHKIVGINGRLDSVQAAVLLAKFDLFVEKEIEARDRIAAYYTEKLSKIKAIKTPAVAEYNRSVWAQYTIITEDRDKLAAHLNSKGIPTAVHYPIPLHMQEVFAGLGVKEGALPVSERVASQVMSLPMCAYKTNEELDTVCAAIAEFFA